MKTVILLGTVVALSMLCCATGAFTDEGMWLFNRPPAEHLKKKYGFEATPKWMEHLQKASVRFNSGGSGSFVSSNGLVMTNHHVGADALQKLSTKERDLLTTGFYAKSSNDELKCVDLELNVLMEIEDVTARVNGAVKEGLDAAAAQKARRAIINTIEKESLDKTKLRSDVVTLYQGGEYHLYRFKKYTDIRLVFAPEKDIAFFGGDPDNFEYPRFDLDVCFFRVYENEKPAKIEHFLAWSEKGAGNGELIFVSGHPGRTDRLNTVSHLEFLRDVQFPSQLNTVRRREVLLKNYSDRSQENARQAQDELFSYQNTRKARLGGLAGLQDPKVMQAKSAAEKTLRDAVAADEKHRAAFGNAWDEVDKAMKAWRQMYYRHGALERGAAFNSELFGIARTILRLSEESTKPNAERLREYNEAGQESLKQQLFSEAPIYPELEIVKLADSLGWMLETLGSNDKFVQRILANKSPKARATELVMGSKLADVALRKQLVEGGAKVVKKSKDPMIELARLIDGTARKIRADYEAKVDEPMRQAYAKIANARFAIQGTGNYPDATFTLRLAFGVVKGYMDNGKSIPPWTTIGGTYDHANAHNNVAPFALPKNWHDRKAKLNMDTPFNFVSTADIIGGNSGSPVVNRKGELVGIIFDGNIQSLVLDFAFSEEQARAVSVHSAAITEALRKVYDAQALADELGK